MEWKKIEMERLQENTRDNVLRKKFICGLKKKKKKSVQLF